jgi:transcriptional regulator with XRE-family HTH domain
MSAPALTPAATLRQARKARRLSQLELSMRLGVSQRHVSFVEGGRARPSRELLAAWLEELEVPLPVRNEALLQAGYAPAYGAARLDDPALERARHALDRLLAAHDPLPALVLDAQWNLLRLNRGGRWLAATLAPGLTLPDEGPAVNLLDLLAHPEGLTTRIVNLHEVGPAMLAHLRHAAYEQPSLAPRVEAFAERLRSRLGTGRVQAVWSSPVAPALTTRYATPHGELSFFSMFTTFGTPQDITLASLRVEHMFAADEATRAVIGSSVR